MAIIANNSRPKVLIPEKVSADGLALLKDKFEVHEKKGLSPEELKGIIGEYEALIVRSETQVTAELLDAAKRLKVVARAGVGVDNVDVQSATTHGIIVVNSPSGNINAAAEHTIACAYPHDGHQWLLTYHSAHGCGTQHWRCITEYQGWQMGTQSTRWV
jgi:D-3-phosphoglycerate dehydrogenase